MQFENAKAVSFAGRVVYVMDVLGRGLAIVDTARQEGVSSEKVRIWIAYKNEEIVLFSRHLDSQIKNFNLVGLTIRCYAAFLDPQLGISPQDCEDLRHEFWPYMSHKDMYGHEEEEGEEYEDEYEDEDRSAWSDWIAANPRQYDK